MNQNAKHEFEMDMLCPITFVRFITARRTFTNHKKQNQWFLVSWLCAPKSSEFGVAPAIKHCFRKREMLPNDTLRHACLWPSTHHCFKFQTQPNPWGDFQCSSPLSRGASSPSLDLVRAVWHGLVFAALTSQWQGIDLRSKIVSQNKHLIVLAKITSPEHGIDSRSTFLACSLAWTRLCCIFSLVARHRFKIKSCVTKQAYQLLG